MSYTTVCCLQKKCPNLILSAVQHEKARQVHGQVLAWMFAVKITVIIIKNTYLVTVFSPYPDLQSAVSQATDLSREPVDPWKFFTENMNHRKVNLRQLTQACFS